LNGITRNGRDLSESPTLSASAQSQYLPNDKFTEPETYDGARDEGVLSRFIDAAKLKLEVSYAHWTPESQVRYIHSRTEKLAWIRLNTARETGQVQTADQVYDALRKWFGTYNATIEAQKAMDQLNQGNKDVSIFLAEFDTIRLKLQMPDFVAKHTILKKINRRLHAKAVTILATTYEEFCDHLIEIEYNLRTFDETRPAATKAVTTPQASFRRPGLAFSLSIKYIMFFIVGCILAGIVGVMNNI
jgi:hypothetical protein